MNEKLVIVPRKTTPVKKLLTTMLFVLSCMFLLLSIFIAPYLFMVPAVITVSLWVWQNYYSNVEYEYTYYDGDLNIAKIKNKAKRKHIVSVNMEDVITIAPKGDRSVYKYETDKSYKYRDLTSGSASAKVYELIFKGEKGMCRYEFEPDEEMLDAIRIKYPRSVVK